jgi:ABC-2 type transport system ATP-binding protein
VTFDASDLAIETRDLTRRFDGRLVLDHVTLAVPRGGVHAVVGRNGAGKSTLYQVLLGFLAASGGTSRVLGFDSAALPPAARGRIGYVYESHPLPGWMRVGELAAMQRALHPGWSEPTFREIAGLFALAAGGRVAETPPRAGRWSTLGCCVDRNRADNLRAIVGRAPPGARRRSGA